MKLQNIVNIFLYLYKSIPRHSSLPDIFLFTRLPGYKVVDTMKNQMY